MKILFKLICHKYILKICDEIDDFNQIINGMFSQKIDDAITEMKDKIKAQLSSIEVVFNSLNL